MANNYSPEQIDRVKKIAADAREQQNRAEAARQARIREANVRGKFDGWIEREQKRFKAAEKVYQRKYVALINNINKYASGTGWIRGASSRIRGFNFFGGGAA